MQAREKSGGVMRLSVDDRIASPDFKNKRSKRRIIVQYV